MDTSAVAKAQAELAQSSKRTADLLDGLAAKLKAAADAGEQHAREWLLDLRETSLSVREESSLAASLANIASLGNPDVIAQTQGSLAERQAQSATLITRLSDKMKACADLGDLNAREWQLDLREAAFSANEQSRVAVDLARAATQPAPVPSATAQHFAASPYVAAPAQQPYTASPYTQPSAPDWQPSPAQPPAAARYQSPQQQGGGFFSRLMGSGFGQAMAMGAGFAIGEEVVEDVIDDIF
ncbi:hypothetical protein Srot_0665 [Segniliparus rotundus DSM 44985]|uniref:Uncharacterized protein n=1 Tax=Segniliparus rotundus (strain ATCC BAA-972 / CDC 1076 / CIP 108378 / DSM 44985 / JCM 13578) TaxID=640132 RepID=D6ZD83_SEGRD|nr:hypothetical protein [Segniliparus rotundus]ADG97147.1 hypothetical protein Srot_0665 [Segniliparus rotundus DSM 44985]